MKTKFNFKTNRGGQLIFAILLVNTLIPSFSNAQVDDYQIYGESLWRNQSYGVENHYFQIENYVIPEHASWFVSPDPVTDNCPYEVYTTNEMPLYVIDLNALANTLKILPYSDNDPSDYRNGVSTLDLYAIQAHLLSSPLFENRTPTEDFPYRYISGDADGDTDVDEDDIDMIQDLILFYRDDLQRNSWAWVHKDEVEDAEERFEEEPYEFIIDDNWPGGEGIILPELSTNQIDADNDKYFTFRTTKVGDITANSGMLITSLNSWVCGSGAYLTDNTIVSRNSNSKLTQKIRQGSIVELDIILDSSEDIYAIELPIYFEENQLSLSKLELINNFSPRWYRNINAGTLIFSDFSKNLSPLEIASGTVAKVVLKVNQDIQNLEDAFGWHSNRSIEILGENESVIPPNVRFEVKSITPPDFHMEIRTAEFDGDLLYIESPEDRITQLAIYSLTGQVIAEYNLSIFKGFNAIALPDYFESGVYLCAIGAESPSTIKWVKF